MPPKLVQHLRADADSMSERLLEKIRHSDRCRDLLLRLPEQSNKGHYDDQKTAEGETFRSRDVLEDKDDPCPHPAKPRIV